MQGSRIPSVPFVSDIEHGQQAFSFFHLTSISGEHLENSELSVDDSVIDL